MSSRIRIESFDTPADLYGNLSRVFEEQENNGTRWTIIKVGDVEVVFFAPREETPA